MSVPSSDRLSSGIIWIAHNTERVCPTERRLMADRTGAMGLMGRTMSGHPLTVDRCERSWPMIGGLLVSEKGPDCDSGEPDMWLN